MNAVNTNTIELECCICFEIMEKNYIKIFTCEHCEFHTGCVIRCNICPLCRAPHDLLDGIDSTKILVSFVNNLLHIIFLNIILMMGLLLIFTTNITIQ